MKNKYLFLFLLPVFALLSYSSGAPSGYTGSPGDGHNCTSCHTFNGTAPTPTITLTGFPSNTYEPGQTYNLHLEVTGVSNPKTGFEITVENASNQKMGSFAPLDNNTQAAQGGNFLTHTSQGNTSHAWDFQWTAPTGSQGNLGIYYAVNIANGNGSTSGDYIQTGYLSLNEVSAVSEQIKDDMIRVYPNPTTEYLKIETKIPVKQIKILNITGKQIQIHHQKNIWDVSSLPLGTYFVQIITDNQQFIRKFIKK